MELLGYEGPYSVGDSFTLTCSFVEGKPPASISWYRNGVILAGETGPTLTIGPLTSDDFGTLIFCRVVNSLLSTPSLTIGIREEL